VGAEQCGGALQQREDVGAVVVAGQGDHLEAVGDAGSKQPTESVQQSGQAVGAVLVEDIPGDQQAVDLVGVDHRAELGDPRERVVGPVDATQAGAQMPIGGVQQFHRRPPCGYSRCSA
jgi:hypothetical protein